MERHARYTAHPGASVCVVSCKLIIKHLIFYFISFYFIFSFTSPGFYSFTTPFAWQNNAPDDEGLASSSLSFIQYSLYKHRRRRRRKEEGGWRAGRGCCCCWGSRSCCLIRHGVFIITSCARVFLASFSSSFFFSCCCVLAIKRWAATHKRTERVCVYIYKDGQQKRSE